MSDIKSCGVLIVKGSPVQSFLLMKHADRWDLPKGHVDSGETELQCALRELEEETGIRPADIRLDEHFRFTTQYTVRSKRHQYQPRQKTTVIFLAELLRDVAIHLTEHPGYQWFDWSPPHHIQPETIDPLLAQLAEYLDRRPPQQVESAS
ncbi:MAG: NUDIX domain-containing protein [Pirellulaceae bacterium]|nr:NUDIX domain-containing protein [Planctomycetales bacterium]